MGLFKNGLFGFRKEEPKDMQKQALKKIALSKVISLKQRGFSRNNFSELSKIFKIFLMKHFDISYEFTHNELKKELNKKEIANELRSKILKVSDLITDINYKNRKLTKELFYRSIKDVEDIIYLTNISMSIKKEIDLLKKGFIEKKIKEIEGAGIERLPKEKGVSKPELMELESLFKMITEAQNALLNFDLEDARHIYLGILHIYKTLPVKQQEKVYSYIKELYDTRKRLSYVLNSPSN